MVFCFVGSVLAKEAAKYVPAPYGENLPYNIEERIAKELYGDSVFDSIKFLLKEENMIILIKQSKNILKDKQVKGSKQKGSV